MEKVQIFCAGCGQSRFAIKARALAHNAGTCYACGNVTWQENPVNREKTKNTPAKGRRVYVHA